MVSRTVSARTVASLLGTGARPTGGPAYQALAEGLRLLIADGRILGGTRLPSERELTGALKVSRTTITRAYAVLRDRGYLTSRRGSGSVATLPGARASAAGPLTPGEVPSGVLDLTCAAPPAPPGTARAYAAALEELPAHFSGTGYHPLGLPTLRRAVADRYTERGLATSAEQIMVTSGALAALAVVCRTMLAAGDRVLMESPTYPNAIATVRRSGARPVGMPMEPQGWEAAAVETALRQSAPRAALLIPDFHNPTGLLMPAQTREALAGALRRNGVVGIVDESMAELWLDSAVMPPPMAAFDPGIITVGGASKSYWGGLRIGWLRAPAEQMAMLTDARVSLDLGVPVLEQLVLLQLLTRRDEVLSHRRSALVASRAALIDALRAQLPDWRHTVPTGGLSLWCELPQPRSSALVQAAEQEGVLLASGGQFAVEGGLESFLRLPYTLMPEQLTDALERISAAWDRATSLPGATTRRTPLVA